MEIRFVWPDGLEINVRCRNGLGPMYAGKTYVIPRIGEIVQFRSGNHKVLDVIYEYRYAKINVVLDGPLANNANAAEPKSTAR